MTGRPGHRTMETNGGSSAPYLARTPYVPLFCTLFNRGGSRRGFRLPGEGGDHSIVRWNLRPVIFCVECSVIGVSVAATPLCIRGVPRASAQKKIKSG